MGPVHLVEPPEQVFGRPVHIVTTRVVGKVIAQGRTAELLPEQIYLVEKQDDARPHEPPGIDDRVEEHQALHHSILPHERQHRPGNDGVVRRRT